MGHDRELIAVVETKRLDAIAAHFQRSPERILKIAARLGLSLKRLKKKSKSRRRTLRPTDHRRREA
jgi:hypothetical protein